MTFAHKTIECGICIFSNKIDFIATKMRVSVRQSRNKTSKKKKSTLHPNYHANEIREFQFVVVVVVIFICV